VRARLIANPNSGADRAAMLLPAINLRLRSLVSDLDITLTTGEDDIGRAATRAVLEGCDLLFVAGGDGTINAAVRAVALVPGGLARVTFGIIPAGTGNDFAKALGLGEVPETALDVLLQANYIDVDLGELNGRVFFNVSAGGFIAQVSATITDELKDATGKLAYVIGGARVLFGREPFSTTLRVGGQEPGPPMDLQMFAVCNARFIGGGYPIAPAAVIDDGLLDVFLVKRTPLLEFVALLQKIAAGDHAGDERVQHFRASEMELVFDRELHVNTDGEVLQASRCEYRVRHRAARFLCGPETQAGGRPRPLVV
jgi:diacylglycerol kinase (ATP)